MVTVPAVVLVRDEAFAVERPLKQTATDGKTGTAKWGRHSQATDLTIWKPTGARREVSPLDWRRWDALNRRPRWAESLPREVIFNRPLHYEPTAVTDASSTARHALSVGKTSLTVALAEFLATTSIARIKTSEQFFERCVERVCSFLSSSPTATPRPSAIA